MKCKTQVALAVGAGYLLGRTRKGKWAIGVGAAALTGGLGGATGQLMRRGTKLLGSSDVMNKLSPELSEITNTIRGELLDAAKAAAMTAVTSRVESLSDNLRDRADSLRQPTEAVQDVTGDVTRRTRDATRRVVPHEDEEAEDIGDEEDLEEPDEAEEAPPRRSSRRRSSEPAEPEDEEEEEPPTRRRPRSTRSVAAAASSPIRRARR